MSPANASLSRFTDRFDALVVGAGLAGSATAIFLARAGWRIAIVEKRCFPRRKVCGECLAASNLPLLHALGVGERFEAVAGPELRRVTYLSGNEAIAAALPRNRNSSYPWGRALGRETLDDLLLGQARELGIEVLQPYVLRSIDGRPTDWHCILRGVRQDSERPSQPLSPMPDIEVRAGELIDAHGSWENFPAPGLASLGKHRTSARASDLLAFKANFRDSSFARGHIGVMALDGGYGGMVEADDGVATLACCVRRSRIDALRADAPGKRAGDVVEAWIRASCAGIAQSLEGAAREGTWLATGPIRTGIRVHRRDGILRVGNAAGEAHPILGEGMSMALQGAALLAGILLESGRVAPAHRVAMHRRGSIEDRYAVAWQRAFASRVRLAAILAHASMRPASALLSTRLLRYWPSTLTQVARWGGKTTSVPIANQLAPVPVSFHNQEPE